MRRADREVGAIDALLQIMDNCMVCRVGMQDENGLYIVPLNFGYTYEHQQLILYFHSAKEGRKLNAISKNPEVCFEMDCNHQLTVGQTACSYAYRFQSIVGNGLASMVHDPKEKILALRQLMHHQTQRDFDFDEQQADSVAVFKIQVKSFSGKQHD